MKKIISTILALALIFMSAGCANERKFNTLDGKYCITAPSGWKDMTGKLAAKSSLELGGNKDRFLILGEYSSEDYSSFENFSIYMLYFLQGIVEDGSSKGTETITVNGRPAYATALMGTLEGKEVFLISYTVDFGEEYIQMIVWTQANLYSEKCEKQLRQVAESLDLAESVE